MSKYSEHSIRVVMGRSLRGLSSQFSSHSAYGASRPSARKASWKATTRGRENVW